MKRTLIEKILNDGRYDTKRYRYKTVMLPDGSIVIKRILRTALGTTAALTDASDTNPDGWQIVKIIN